MIEYFGERQKWCRVVSPAENSATLWSVAFASIPAAILLLAYGVLIVLLVRMNERYREILATGLATTARVTAVHVSKNKRRVMQSLDLEFSDNHDRKVLGHTGYFSPKVGTWAEGDEIPVHYDRMNSTRFAINYEETKK